MSHQSVSAAESVSQWTREEASRHILRRGRPALAALLAHRPLSFDAGSPPSSSRRRHFAHDAVTSSFSVR